MNNNFSSSANAWQTSNNLIDSLNQLDTVSVLSESDLQNELSIFANAEFNKPYNEKKEKKSTTHMHSLLNVKLASLAENNYHTFMSPDAVNRFYENESPDCTPPNGYYSPNPTPPNGFYSPNPTPPNGIHLNNSPTVFQGVVNPPITFYDDASNTKDDEADFIKTMTALTSTSEEESRTKKNSSIPLTKEDKRRRNTAASARFRVKKKLREQALQKTADEMTEKAKMFENRVHELEREVQWLKALIVEKNDGKIEQLLLQQYGQQYNPINYNHLQ